MLDFEILDLASNAHTLDLFAIDENFEDSLHFTDLASDDIIQGLQASFDLEKEVDSIMHHDSGASKCLHSSFMTNNIDEQDEKGALEEQDSPLNILDDHREEYYKPFSENKCSAGQQNLDSSSMTVALEKLNECMKRTARTRTLISKKFPPALKKKLLQRPHNAPIKGKSEFVTKRRLSSMLRSRRIRKVPLLKALDFENSGLLRKPHLDEKLQQQSLSRSIKSGFPALPTSRNRCSIADFLRDSKATRPAWYR